MESVFSPLDIGIRSLLTFCSLNRSHRYARFYYSVDACKEIHIMHICMCINICKSKYASVHFKKLFYDAS